VSVAGVTRILTVSSPVLPAGAAAATTAAAADGRTSVMLACQTPVSFSSGFIGQRVCAFYTR